MDKYVNIGSPTLSSGSYFEVRYRLLPNGIWQDFGQVMTQSFILTGLADGNYELEVTYYLADGASCTPSITDFTVTSVSVPPPSCTCLTVTNVYINIDCTNIITINATVAQPYPTNCGIRITYISQNGDTAIVLYTNDDLPSQLQIPISYSNGVTLKIEIYCCATQQWITCYDNTITDIRRCECTSPPTITNETYVVNADGTSVYGVTFTASVPDTPPYSISFTPTIGASTTYTQNVQSAGTYYFTLPSTVFAARGKWLTVVSNQCGQDSSNGG